MLNEAQIEELLPAFEGIDTDDGNLVSMLRHDLPTGLVQLTPAEVEAVARRILELNAIVAQNALVGE